MCDNNKQYDESFYNEDYFQNGKQSGKSWYENFRWMPRRTFKEALAFIDTLDMNDDSFVLDYGCSYGFMVRALRILNIKADGCDISKHALSVANPDWCWDCSNIENWYERLNKYDYVIAKDVLEHLTIPQLEQTLENLKSATVLNSKMMIVVPMGDFGVYRIPEYHYDKSHILAECEEWWISMFENNGWSVIEDYNHVDGIKDSWYDVKTWGNHVFILGKTK